MSCLRACIIWITQVCFSLSRQLFITTRQPAAVTPWHSTATLDTSYATDLKMNGTGIRRQWLSWSKQQWLGLQRLVSTAWEFIGESQQRTPSKGFEPQDILESSICGTGSKILPTCLYSWQCMGDSPACTWEAARYPLCQQCWFSVLLLGFLMWLLDETPGLDHWLRKTDLQLKM